MLIFSKHSAQKQLEEKMKALSEKETENLVGSFRQHFEECTKACKKPNILLAGVTGAGKSSLCNAVFGEDLADVNVGLPVTQHFQKYEPKNKPVVIYDSKGLELSEAESFIKETGKFFKDLQLKTDVHEHIHCIWYVVNAGRARFEDFEAELVKEVFNPTPVIFVLNKADLADAKQLKALQNTIRDHKFPNSSGCFITVSSRTNFSQGWCPNCLHNDVFIDEETKELECTECGLFTKLEPSFGLDQIIQHTVSILPELAKDAFLYSQTASITEKDKRAKSVVKTLIKNLNMDLKGNFIKKIAEMCAKLLVIWGWPLTADTFQEGLADIQKEYLQRLKFQERMAASLIDKVLGSFLSRSMAALVGLVMNKGMKKLNVSLIENASKGMDKLNMDNFKQDFFEDNDVSELLITMFIQTAIFKGLDIAIDKYWSMTAKEVEDLSKEMDMQEMSRNSLFGLNFDDMQLSPEELERMQVNDVVEGGTSVDLERMEEELKEEAEKEEDDKKKEDSKKSQSTDIDENELD